MSPLLARLAKASLHNNEAGAVRGIAPAYFLHVRVRRTGKIEATEHLYFCGRKVKRGRV